MAAFEHQKNSRANYPKTDTFDSGICSNFWVMSIMIWYSFAILYKIILDKTTKIYIVIYFYLVFSIYMYLYIRLHILGCSSIKLHVHIIWAHIFLPEFPAWQYTIAICIFFFDQNACRKKSDKFLSKTKINGTIAPSFFFSLHHFFTCPSDSVIFLSFYAIFWWI